MKPRAEAPGIILRVRVGGRRSLFRVVNCKEGEVLKYLDSSHLYRLQLSTICTETSWGHVTVPQTAARCDAAAAAADGMARRRGTGASDHRGTVAPGHRDAGAPGAGLWRGGSVNFGCDSKHESAITFTGLLIPTIIDTLQSTDYHYENVWSEDVISK